MLRTAFIAAFAVLAHGLVPAAAQERTEVVTAFSGQWFLFDPAYREAPDSTCTLILQGESPAPLLAETQDVGDRLPAEMQGCNWQLAPITLWNVEDGMLRFYDPSLELVAELGGTQRRITGTTSPEGLGIVLERASGDGNSETIALAVQRHRCYFLGLTAYCISDADRTPPQFDVESGLARIELVANLVVRNEPRRDAPSVGTIPQGTCVRVNQCLIASDGTWCRARFGDVTAWLPQVALRQQEWPIYTYRNGCPETAE